MSLLITDVPNDHVGVYKGDASVWNGPSQFVTVEVDICNVKIIVRLYREASPNITYVNRPYTN